MSFDGWSLLMALAVIFLPLLLAGALLGRPPRATKNARAEAPHSKPSNEKP